MHEYFSTEDLDFRNLIKFSLHFWDFSAFSYKLPNFHSNQTTKKTKTTLNGAVGPTRHTNKERGEKSIDTIRREINEETGIRDLTFINGFEKEISYRYRREHQLIFKNVLYRLARTHSKEVVLSCEHRNFAWDPYEVALKRLTYKKSKEILSESYKFLTNL